MLWKKLEEWAATVYGLVRELGMQEAVMTVDELSSGDEVRGTGAHACSPARLSVVEALAGGLDGTVFSLVQELGMQNTFTTVAKLSTSKGLGTVECCKVLLSKIRDA